MMSVSASYSMMSVSASYSMMSVSASYSLGCATSEGLGLVSEEKYMVVISPYLRALGHTQLQLWHDECFC